MAKVTVAAEAEEEKKQFSTLAEAMAIVAPPGKRMLER